MDNYRKNIASGLWKFKHTVPIDDLIKVADAWAQEDSNYLELYIRQASKDQNGIGFMYQLEDTDPEEISHDQYFDRTSDILKRKFGNDLVGWDISSPTYIIKK